LVAAIAMPADSRQPRVFGKYLVAQYQLPAKTIARYAAMAAGTAGDELARADSMFADRLPWIGPEQRAGVGSNPYTLVLTVSGVAKASGEVYSQWQAGWEVHESAGSREIVMAVPGAVRAGVTSGERVSLTANTARVSFRGERRVAPMLGLVQTRNLDIDDVYVQLWSGNAPMTSPATPLSPRVLLAVAAVCLLLWWSFSRWQATSNLPVALAALDPEPERTTLPARDPVGHDQAALARLAPHSPDPGHKAKVIDALSHVLTVGLTVKTVFDDARMLKGRASRKERAAAP